MDILTLGSTCAPPPPTSRGSLGQPDEFARWKRVGEVELGFAHVESGPLVRSSYHAKEQAREVEAGKDGRYARSWSRYPRPCRGLAPASPPPDAQAGGGGDPERGWGNGRSPGSRGFRGRAGSGEDRLGGFSRDELLGILRNMLLYRRFEEKAEESYAIGKIGGFCHLHIGQEGAAEGCIRPLRDDDYVITAYRDHTQALAKGLSPERVLAELFGRSAGVSGGKGGSMHLFGAEHGFMGGHGIVGGQIPLATGMGWAVKYRQEDRVVMCFMGDAAVNQGALHESLNMAAIWHLPVIYVVENNEYGMGTAFRRISATEISDRSAAYGIPSSVVNGQDVLATYRHMEGLVREVREGGGPASWRYERTGSGATPCPIPFRERTGPGRR